MYCGEGFAGIKLAFRPALHLLKGNLFQAPAFLSHQLLQALKHLGADLRRIIGKIDQVPLAILKYLETEAVTPVKRYQRAIDRTDAAFIAIPVARRAQLHRDLLRRMFLILLLLCKRNV